MLSGVKRKRNSSEEYLEAEQISSKKQLGREEHYAFDLIDESIWLNPPTFSQNLATKMYRLPMLVDAEIVRQGIKKITFTDGAVTKISQKRLLRALKEGLPGRCCFYTFTLMAFTFKSSEVSHVVSLEVVGNIANLLLADYKFYHYNNAEKVQRFRVKKKDMLQTQTEYWRVPGEVLYLKNRAWLRKPYMRYLMRLYELLEWDDRTGGRFSDSFFEDAEHVN